MPDQLQGAPDGAGGPEERLLELGRLVAEVAHELSGPLQAVIARAELLLRQEEGAGTREAAHRILRAGRRCRAIVQQLLAHAREDPEGLAPVQVEDVALEVLEQDRATEPGEIEVRLESQNPLPAVLASAPRLVQVLHNLVANARQAAADAGVRDPVRVVLDTVPGDRSHLGLPAHRPAVCIAVEDRGPGVPPEMAEHIFEPFFTTKPAGAGTGLGLSVSRRMVAGMGGVLWLDPGHTPGARFVVELPGTERTEDETGGGEDGPAGAPEPCRVLLVDDDRDVLDTYEVVLRMDGNHVRSCSRAGEALEILKEEAFDAVLCDMRLPDRSGPELLEILQEQDPDLAGRVVFATGDVVNEDTRAFLNRIPNPSLMKPFQIEDLQEAIAAVVRARGRRAGKT